MLDIQEEVDKHHTSLWAYKEIENSKQEAKIGGIKNDSSKQPSFTIDEDCMSCSLDKYRPAIKEAFKMACLSYKPSSIPFHGRSYQRKEVLEFKEMLLNQVWIQCLNSIEYLKKKVNW